MGVFIAVVFVVSFDGSIFCQLLEIKMN